MAIWKVLISVLADALACGGTLRLVQEPLLDAGWISQLPARIADHPLLARALTLATGVVALSVAALQALQGCAGAASVLAADGAFVLSVDDMGCVTDIDTVADFQAAKRHLAAP